MICVQICIHVHHFLLAVSPNKLQIATQVFVSRTESSLGHFEDLNNRVSVVIICPVAYRIVHFKD